MNAMSLSSPAPEPSGQIPKSISSSRQSAKTAITHRIMNTQGFESLSDNQLSFAKDKLEYKIWERKQEIRSRSEYDATYWQMQVELLEAEEELTECTSVVKYREDMKEHKLSYTEWAESVELGRALSRKKSAIGMKLSAVKAAQTDKLPKHGGPSLDTWIKLFFGPVSGRLDSDGDSSLGQRDRDAQAKMRKDMRKDMMKRYHTPEDVAEMPGHAWEPIVGTWERKELFRRAHLYPSKSIEYSDVIFGTGSEKDIMTARNGLFLDPILQEALEQGYLAIVPDVIVRPELAEEDQLQQKKSEDPAAADLQEEEEEYKVIVLEKDSEYLRKTLETLFVSPGYDIKSIDHLDGRRLRFLTEFRPDARYMWWTYLNSIANLSYRHKHQHKSSEETKETSDSLARAVELGNRCWVTRGPGKYVKWKNQLYGLAKQLDVYSSSSSTSTSIVRASMSILEHAIATATATATDEGCDGAEPDIPDQVIVAVVANAAVERAKAHLRKLGEGVEEEEEVDDDDDDDGDDSSDSWDSEDT